MNQSLIHKQQRDIAANIRRLRVERGLTQASLADRLEISQQQVQKWERGTVSFSTARLEAIAKELDSSVLELMKSGDDGSRASKPARPRPLSALEHELLDAFGRIQALSKKRLVVQLTKAVADGATAENSSSL